MGLKNLLQKHSYVWLSLVVVVTWGLVPALAKLGDLPGGLTTLYVNWFAVAGILIIMSLNGSIWELKRAVPYRKLILIGLVWPFVYSILYFNSVHIGSPALTTIANYFWPVFYLFLASLFFGKRFLVESWLVVIVAVVAVAVPLLLEGGLNLIILPLILGLGAAASQAWFNLATEKPAADPWVTTLVIEIVTAIGSTIYVLFFEQLVVPSLTTLGYLGIIGVFSNGIGFWAFQRSGNESNKLGERANISRLMILCLTPLIQVVLLPILGVELVKPARWIGVVLISLGLVGYHLLSTKRESENNK